MFEILNLQLIRRGAASKIQFIGLVKSFSLCAETAGVMTSGVGSGALISMRICSSFLPSEPLPALRANSTGRTRLNPSDDATS